MVILLPVFVSVLLAGTLADTKILDTPDGKLGPEPCVRVCSGVDKDYTGWVNSGYHSGKVNKKIDISGCDFVSVPVVTVVSGGFAGKYRVCPSVTVSWVSISYFNLYSVSDITKNRMIESKCRVYWTATGFTC